MKAVANIRNPPRFIAQTTGVSFAVLRIEKIPYP
jgi:hypothetical protein